MERGETDVRKGLRIMGLALAVMTVMMCLLLVWQAADIYLTGNRPENFSAPGVRIRQVYSREDIAARFERFAPAVYVYLAAVAVGLVWQAAAGKEKPRPTAIPPAAAKPARHLAAVRLVLLGAAAALVVLGAMNGGARDVLVKAVNICTECIGLG